MKNRLIAAAVLGSGMIVAGGANALNWNPSEWLHKTTAETAQVSPAVVASTDAAPIPFTSAPDYAAIVKRYGPAVVGITTEGMAKTSARGVPYGLENDPFFQFFRGLPGYEGMIPQHETPVHGLGSGFIVREDGLILTNAHVVRDADEVMVKLADKREYKAKVLGSDPATDVAVLKIDADNLPVVTLGDPSRLHVGDYVLAIGSPFGFERSATAGIVSAKGRSLPGDSYVPFIQTDVAVNPGNSGGPLFDASGAVIGINSQIYSKTGGYQGVSFAIPIDVALHVQEQIVTTGHVSRARLGVTIQEVNQALAESFQLEQPSGALVSNVEPGSAAAEAGLQSGDVILKYNGQEIRSSGDLPALVGMDKPGDQVEMEIWREGETVQLTATLGEGEGRLAANDTDDSASHGKLGIAVRPLTPQEQREAQIASGVVVEQTSGPAARAGIRAGDVILSVNGTTVQSVSQLQELVSEESEHVALLVQRGEVKIFVPVNLG